MEDAWDASYTQSALDFIMEQVTSERVAQKLFEYRRLLQEVPDLGKLYDPDYAAAKTPFSCRELPIPDTPFTLYYTKDDTQRRIIIFCVEFQRVDPNARFSRIDYGIVDW